MYISICMYFQEVTEDDGASEAGSEAGSDVKVAVLVSNTLHWFS